jgi:S-DNA-T family DNA segregation ATPase FtsK/SpoIIIE
MAKKSASKKTKPTKQAVVDEDYISVGGIHIRRETKNGIVAIGFFVLTALFTLSGFDLGGVAGHFIYKNLSTLLGVGYALLPVVFLLLGFSSYKSERPTFGTSNAVSSLLFLFSGLGIIHIIKAGSAGIVGHVMAWPFVKLFDVYLAFILLLAIFIISLVIMFDRRPSFHSFMDRIKRLFGIQQSKEEEYYEEEEVEEEQDGGEEEEETPEPEKQIPLPTPEPEKKDAFAMSAAWKSSGKYVPPPITLLAKNEQKAVTGDIKANSNIIKRTLENFGINVEMDEVTVGPTVTRFALKPAQGVRLSRITALQNELRLALAAPSIRIQAPIPGQSLVGIEVPNQTKALVDLRSLIAGKEFKDSAKPLLVAPGRA